MERPSAVSTLANQSEHSNSSLLSDWRARTSEYSDAQLVLLGVVMAILVLAIVFGELENIPLFLLGFDLVDLLIYGSKDLFTTDFESSFIFFLPQVMCW